MSSRYAFLRWLPAVVLMVSIFTLSSIPATGLPFFGDYDVLIKKAGHALGYALLGLAYYIALPPRLSRGYRWALGLLMALLFALSDEYHQSFVDGRTSSLRDVLIDGVGAAVAVSIGAVYSSNSRSKATS
ncbi:MAG TPA: VanZ family protein [Anaerolineales bacterium]|jgi:VanZ family protein